jgi:glutamate/aspartate transport system substrate-binding protein
MKSKIDFITHNPSLKTHDIFHDFILRVINMVKLSSLICVLFLVTSSVWAADGVPALKQIDESGKIRIGYRQALPPMSFEDEQGKPIGYTIDLCNLIVTEIKTSLKNPNIEVEYIPVNADNRFSALTDNKIDILCGATTKTLSRGELVDFTQLTFITGAGFFSLKEMPVQTIPDLSGQKIAVVQNTTTEKALRSILDKTATDTEVIFVDSTTQGKELLDAGKVIAYTADQIVLIGMLMNADQPKNYFVGGNVFSFDPLALAVRRNDSAFRLVADRVLSRVYANREIESIYAKWLGRISNKVPNAIAAVYEINSTPE